MLSRVDNSLSVLRDPGRLHKSSPRPPGAELKSLRAGSRLQLTSNYPAFQKMLSGHAPRHVQEPSLIPAHVSVCSLEGTSPVLWGVLGSQQGPALGGLLPGNKDNGCRNASRWVTYARPLPTLSKGACWWGRHRTHRAGSLHSGERTPALLGSQWQSTASWEAPLPQCPDPRNTTALEGRGCASEKAQLGRVSGRCGWMAGLGRGPGVLAASCARLGRA